MTAETAQHTETPWRAREVAKHHFYIEAASRKPGNGSVCELQAYEWDTPEGRVRLDANAAFIVRACNSHEGLLAACREALESAHWYQDNGLSGRDYDIHLFEAAIALAEGRET